MISRFVDKLFDREILRQSALAFVVRILAALSGFFLSVVLARALGAEQAGYYFLAFSLVSVISVVSRLGLDLTVLRFTAASLPEKNSGQVRFTLFGALLLTSFLALLLSTAVYFFSDIASIYMFGKPELANPLKSMAFGVLGLALLTLVAMSLQGLRRIASSVFVTNIAVNFILIALILLYPRINAQQLATFYSISTISVFFIALLYWWILCPRWPDNGDNCIHWNELLKSCMPLWVVMVMAQLIQWVGLLMAGAWVTPAELAQLAVAQRTAMLTSFVLIAVNLVVAPRFAAMHIQGDVAGISKVAKHSVRLMLLFALPLALVMLFFPDFFMGFFGDEFVGAGYLLQIMVIGQLVNVTTGSVGYLLSMTGNENAMRNAMLIAGPFAIVVSVVLVPLLGAVGSAIAIAIAVASQNLLAAWYVRKHLGINTLAIWR